MSAAVKKILSACVVLSILFAGIARAPGTMLTLDHGVLTFEICTGTGIEIITVPVDGSTASDDAPLEDHDLGCDFFSAQIAALLGDGSPPVLAFADMSYAHRLPYRDIAFKRLAQNSYLTRAPPLTS